MTYYFEKNGEVEGPVSLSELQRLRGRGEITGNTNVCLEGESSWTRLTEILHGNERRAEPPPIVLTATTSHSPAPLNPTPQEKRLEYLVLPFVASIHKGGGARDAAIQLQLMIETRALEGWEYIRMEQLETYIAGDNGCFGFNSTPARSTVYSMVVFKR
jgi:hypothetical protein